MPRPTIREILDSKGKKKYTQLNVTNADTAAACEEAGIDMLGIGARNMKAIREAAPNMFIIVAAPRPSYKSSNAEAISACFELMEGGADAVYMCPGLERIRAVAEMKIPVFGHAGFVPDHMTWIGNPRAVGKTADEAWQVYQDVLAHQEAGAAGVELEVVPHRIATEISKRVNLFVVSLGSGAGCDAEYLFSSDILGTHQQHYPRHSKVYRHHFEETVAALREFRSDVEDGRFPGKNETVPVKDEEYERFLEAIA
jgi:3-methyl-2-oxobutanoate hydroxymethyltransferase